MASPNIDHVERRPEQLQIIPSVGVGLQLTQSEQVAWGAMPQMMTPVASDANMQGGAGEIKIDEITQEMGTLKIEYLTPDPMVTDVFVMGEFNSWNLEALDMKGMSEDGLIKFGKDIEVPNGYKYRFQFLVNGEFVTDPR